jgi:hypothetical protein
MFKKISLSKLHHCPPKILNDTKKIGAIYISKTVLQNKDLICVNVHSLENSKEQGQK